MCEYGMKGTRTRITKLVACTYRRECCEEHGKQRRDKN